MIEATQKKLRETKFFLRLLIQASQQVARNEPEEFEFYLNAFLSNARSVTFTLQYEEKDRYDAWFSRWLADRREEDRRLLNFLKEQRNYVEKRAGAEFNVAWEFVPVTEVRNDSRGHPVYEVHWFGPPDISPPRVGRPVHSLELAGDRKQVTSTCERYVDILDKLVRDFIQAHSGN